MLIALGILYFFQIALVFLIDNQIQPINEMTYKKMPELSNFNDYRDCLTTYNDDFRYCVTHVYIQPNQTSELWKYIEDFSSKTNQHYRHDVLKRGICMNDCWEKVKKINRSVFITETDAIFEPYPAKIGEKMPMFKGSVEDFLHANLCNNLELYENYGLQSVTKINFCLTKDGEDVRKSGDKLDKLFVTFITFLIGLITLSTIFTFRPKETALKNPFSEYLSCFCLRRNWAILMNIDTSQSLLFAGLKLAPLGVLICGHAFSALNAFYVVDSFKLESSVHRSSAVTVRGWQLFMPIFFLISGYLSSYSWIGKLLSGEKAPSCDCMIQSLIRRIVRLVPSMAVVVFFFSTRLYSFYSNPKWLEVVASERVNCRNNGWSNLVFFNNLKNKKDGCLNQAWSISAEVQLFVITILLKEVLQKFPKHIVKVLTIVFLVSNITVIFIAYTTNVHGLLIGIEPLRNQRYYDDNFNLSYIHPVTYLSPWTLGLLLAVLSNKLRAKKINIFNSMRVRCIIIFLIVTSFFFGSVITNEIFRRNSNEKLPLWIIIGICLGRNLCIFPSLCVLNFGGRSKNDTQQIEDKLSSKLSKTDFKFLFWAYPLAKIGYTGFLSHFPVIYLVLGKHLEYDSGGGLNLFSYFSQVILFSIVGGTILKLGVEQPICNLYQLISFKVLKYT